MTTNYSTRDRLVVLSLASIMGTDISWDKIATTLSNSARSFSISATYHKGYTQKDCKAIYQEETGESVIAEPSAINKIIHKLKNERVKEIQNRLDSIASTIKGLDMAQKASEIKEEEVYSTPKEEPALEWEESDAAHTETKEPDSETSVQEISATTLPTEIEEGKDAAVDEQHLKNWKKNIGMVWRDISGHRQSSMFLSPIKAADAPNYFEVIRQPLDLKTIKNRIRDEEITTTTEFYRDIMHMLVNALMYNSEDTEVYEMAMEMVPDAQTCIEQLLQTEATVTSNPDDDDAMEEEIEEMFSSPDPAEADNAENSDASSVPAKRKRRVASERASKHLRQQ